MRFLEGLTAIMAKVERGKLRYAICTSLERIFASIMGAQEEEAQLDWDSFQAQRDTQPLAAPTPPPPASHHHLRRRHIIRPRPLCQAHLNGGASTAPSAPHNRSASGQVPDALQAILRGVHQDLRHHH